MATYNIKWLRNLFGTRFFPVTHITAVRDNNNVNLETLLNNKADEATTLAGYGITDAYTKTDSNSRFYALSGVTYTSGSSIDVTTLDAGTYYISSVDKLINPPTRSQNGLSTYFWVLKPNDRHTIIRLQISDSPNIWEKYYMASSGWSNWVLVQDNLNKYAALAGGSELGASSSNAVDLNNITTQGTYYNGTSSNAQYISNRPNTDNEIFRLWVYDCGGSTIIQRYRANSMAITYERMGLNSWGGMFTWGNWVLVQEDLSHYALSAGSSSDARLKDKVDDINLNVEDIAKAPNLTFKWKNGKDNNLHGGTYAQYWENITPYYVHGSDSKTLEYGNLALTCSIELAKEMTKLKEENVQLKKELEDIKETLNKLNK